MKVLLCYLDRNTEKSQILPSVSSKFGLSPLCSHCSSSCPESDVKLELHFWCKVHLIFRNCVLYLRACVVFLQNFAKEFMFSDLRELDEDNIRMELKKAGGANYDAQVE